MAEMIEKCQIIGRNNKVFLGNKLTIDDSWLENFVSIFPVIKERILSISLN